ncbi:MAG: hypothetical protein JNM56_04490 [Planctomycetia bacterium]|nr:hypothetical protein [Planctomycetia bacterium]
MGVYHEVGKHRATIVGQRLGENNNGNSELQLEIQPLAFYVDGEPQAYHDDWTRTIFLPLTAVTLGTESKVGWVTETLRYLGFQGTSFSELDPTQEGHHSFVGLEIDVWCGHREFEGKKSERWSVLRPGNRTAVKALDKKGLRALDAKFGKVLKAFSDKPKPVAADSNNGQAANSDVPF